MIQVSQLRNKKWVGGKKTVETRVFYITHKTDQNFISLQCSLSFIAISSVQNKVLNELLCF